MSNGLRVAIAEPTRLESIIARLKEIMNELVGISPEHIDTRSTFFEMGADSLLLLQGSQAMEARFGIKIPFRMLFEEMPTLEAVAAYIEARLPTEALHDAVSLEPHPQQQPSSIEQVKSEIVTADPGAITPASEVITTVMEREGSEPVQGPQPKSALERVIEHQLLLMGQQLELLKTKGGRKQAATPAEKLETTLAGNNGKSAIKAQDLSRRTANTSAPVPADDGGRKATTRKSEPEPYVAYQPIRKDFGIELTQQQQAHMQGLIERVAKRTAGSKRLAEERRPFLADSRAAAGFRSTLKEVLYPITVKRAAGARVWDVDGNEYVDVTMGFGSLLFGHSPSFIVEAVREQVSRGIQLGLESELAGKAARLICELTGVERVAFCNSGTEAIMSALRLARTVTGRTRIAMFEGSYHGTFDGVMVRRERIGDPLSAAMPLAPGVPRHMVENVTLLKFNSPDSLEILRDQSRDLAAVLVEPPQSRRPDLNPAEFLREVRRLTSESGTALIFDEVVTGFRTHAGGAQAIFNVKADLVTYGKALGGGVPVAAIGGKAAYMDAIDGGMWSYGDASFPRAETTFVAGTYFKNPLVIAAVWGALNHIKENSPRLQHELEQNTARLVNALNAHFEQQGLPLRMAHFGSLFRFLHTAEVKAIDLLYYHLLEKGVYICETRNCFLSTAHTDEDIYYIIRAIKESVADMQRGGFLPAPLPDVPRPTGLSTPEQAKATTGEQDSRTIALTESQKQLWLLAQMGDEASRAYNESLTLHLRGPLNYQAMVRAVQNLVNRHEALRATFSPQGDFQRVHAQIELAVPLVDFSNLDETRREAEVAAWIEKEVRLPFDFIAGPLLRVSILRLDEQYHQLVLTIHHIITDGWSNGILIRELKALYSAECLGVRCDLPEPVGFSKYAESQRQEQEREDKPKDEIYWVERFADSVPILELPADRPRPPVQTYTGARYTTTIDTPAYNKLKALSARHGTTLFMTLLAAYQVLLHRLTGQDDIVVGIPSAGRSSADDRDLVGYCVKLLPLRTRANGDPGFSQYLAGVKKELSEAQDHQEYSFIKLIKSLNLPRDPSRTPLITATFNLDRSRSETIKFHDLDVDVALSPSSTAKFDIVMNLTERGNDIAVACEYNTDLFEPETIKRWMRHFHTLLGAVVESPDREISALPLLDEQERGRLLVEWNRTEAEYPTDECIHEMFESQVERTPEALAVAFDSERLSYAELNSRANRLANYLRSLGAGRDARIGLYLDHSIEMVVGVLGVLKAGAAYVPLDLAHPKARVAFMLEDAQISFLLTAKDLATNLPDTAAKVICVDAEWEEIAGWSDEGVEDFAAPDDVAYVIYTSGSTGNPKGVQIQHKALVNYICWAAEVYLDGERLDFPLYSSLAFDLTVTSLFTPLITGNAVVVYRKQDRESPVVRILEEDKVGVLKLTPSHLSLVKDRDNSKSRIKRLIVGGEALESKLARDVYNSFGGHVEIINEYGPTETTVGAMIYRFDATGDKRAFVPIGRPAANVKIYILDVHLQPVPHNVAGELYISGAGLALGYLNRPDLTAERFIKNPFVPGSLMYKTGDKARTLVDDNLEFVGRTDDQVKFHGYRVELNEIRSALNQHPQIRDSVVRVLKDVDGNDVMVAYYVSRQELEVSALRSHLSESIIEETLPNVFVHLKRLPLTLNGKVNYQALPSLDEARESIKRTFVLPRNEAESIMARIWAQVLRVKQVGIYDNFFELGGDSILGIQIIARANQLGLRLTAKQIFEHRTVAELAAVAVPATRTLAEQGVVTGQVPLTPIQHWFFQQQIVEPHHFNQASMFELREEVSAAQMRKVVAALLTHHDALRLCFRRKGHLWSQTLLPPSSHIPLIEVDLSEIAEAGLPAQIERAATLVQSSISLDQGSLLRAALFDLGPGESQRLLVAIHHLAVDVVSWRVIVEDLYRGYESARGGQEVRLAEKTTSYKRWAERLSQYAQGDEVRGEADYWVSLGQRAGEEDKASGKVPVDFEGGTNNQASARSISEGLSEEETTELVSVVGKAYGTSVVEALMSAVGEAVGEWTGEREVVMEVEGHGREEVMEGVDVTRTVGWFTSLYPVVIEAGGAAEGVGEKLRRVKETVRSVPNGGIGYGALKYLSEDKEIAERLRSMPGAEISFNYMGRGSQNDTDTSSSESAPMSNGATRSPLGRRPHIIEINSFIASRRLHIHFTYSENVHRQSTIAALARNVTEWLRSIIAHTRATKPTSFTTPDFSEFGWTSSELEEAGAAIRKSREGL